MNESGTSRGQHGFHAVHPVIQLHPADSVVIARAMLLPGTPVADGVTATERIPPGHKAIVAHVPGNVWKIAAAPGDRVVRDQALVVLESMKMEISVHAQESATVTEVLCAEGKPVQAGDVLAILKTDA